MMEPRGTNYYHGKTNYSEPTNSCYEESTEPGCADLSCEGWVCHEQPHCCSRTGSSWDSLCVERAERLCADGLPEILRRPQNTSCALGYLCDRDRIASCDQIRGAAIDFYGVGDIYAGIYCPEGSNRMMNCPAGSYCPDPSTILPCPTGYFCPHKTASPEFKCGNCSEGAPKLARAMYGYVAIFLLASTWAVSLGLLLAKRRIRSQHKRQEPRSEKGPVELPVTTDRRYAMSQVKVDALFDEMMVNSTNSSGSNEGKTQADNDEDVILVHRFFASSMSCYLSEAQIQYLIKKFRDIGTVSGQSGALLSTPHQQTVSRSTFREYYPAFLVDVMVDCDDDCTALESTLEHEDSFVFDTVQSAATAVATSVDIAFQDLSLSVQVNGKTINVIDRVGGRLKAKSMTALMGGSGSGKTSLLNALCGRAYYGEVSGKTHVNGHPSSIEEHADAVGFVPQDDIVYAELTVRENLIYSGKFRLPRGTELSEIERLADTTMASLGLSRIANSPVGDLKRRGISGGEKKRVNIGLELMARPSAIFLDEPTSGLDSSSALLVMQSLKRLVGTQGVTICSAIHQPRKFIYDLFDSLILLGPGGRIAYHGPTADARGYFEGLGYSLPTGECVADWLLDISCGGLEPDVVCESCENNSHGRRGFAMATVESFRSVKCPNVDAEYEEYSLDDGKDALVADPVIVERSSNGKIEHSIERARLRTEWLCQQWKDSYSNFGTKEIHTAPAAYSLPAKVEKPTFKQQLGLQIGRGVLVEWRKRSNRLIDTAIIVGAVILISVFEGVTEVTRKHDIDLTFDEIVRPKVITHFFPRLFAYALSVLLKEYGLKVGIITAVLIGLVSTRIIAEKRLEFFREAASGYNVNAYFLAINLVATTMQSIQITAAAFFASWLRSSIATPVYVYVHFLLLCWLCVSWGIFLSVVVPSDSVSLAVGFFMSFFGLLFSGGISPVEYTDLYDEGGFMELFSGFVSPTRYFIEGIAVSELRCLPAQSGFTVEDENLERIPLNRTSYVWLGYAMNDLGNATQRSCDGWYWSVLPAFFVGLTIRFAGAGAMHVFGRSKQIKKSLWYDMQRSWITSAVVIIYVLCLGGLFSFTSWLVLRDIPSKRMSVVPSPTTLTTLVPHPSPTTLTTTNINERPSKPSYVIDYKAPYAPQPMTQTPPSPLLPPSLAGDSVPLSGLPSTKSTGGWAKDLPSVLGSLSSSSSSPPPPSLSPSPTRISRGRSEPPMLSLSPSILSPSPKSSINPSHSSSRPSGV